MLASYRLRIMQTSLYWIVALGETAMTLAKLGAQSFWAERIISTFAFGSDLSKVHPSATPTLALGAFLILCGAFLRLQCYHILGSQFTFETGIIQGHKLVTTGPYSVVRHPSYAGAFLAYVGLMLYYASPGSWVRALVQGSPAGRLFGALYTGLMLVVVTGLVLRIPKEDEALKNEFGEEWKRWAVDRYALIPRIY